MLPNIIIKTIPHNEQRYDTVGDYQSFDNGTIVEFRISDLNDPVFEQAISFHEQIEKFFNMLDGITDEMVDEFDLNWLPEKYDEPGLDPACPYHCNHMKADAFERMFIQLCGRSWGEYENKLDELIWGAGI